MKQKSLVFAVAILISTLLLAACSNPQRDILGKWKQNDGDTIEFSADGKVKGTLMGRTFSGKYKFIGDEHIVLDTDNHTNVQNQFKVSGDELILKNPIVPDNEMKYQRVK
jgi:uncharacterized protein (DUF2147 family)